MQLLGLDCLGLAKYSPTALSAFPKGYALGVFSRTFGDSMPAAGKVVKSAGCKALRVQLMWSFNDHNYADSDIKPMLEEAKRWNKFATEHPNLKVYLSPFCEHKRSDSDKILHKVKEAAPKCEPVNSVYTGALSANYINEVHGDKSPPKGGKGYIYSFDGTDMLDSDVQAMKSRHRDAIMWFGWTANFNGMLEVPGPGEKAPPIEKRTAYPSSKLLASMKYVMENGKVGVNLPRNWLWKSHAEDKGIGDLRANKPVLLSPVKAASAQLLRGGKVVSNAPLYGSFPGGFWRYYFPEWGFEIAQKTGGAPLDLSVGGKVYGKVNPAFREGSIPK